MLPVTSNVSFEITDLGEFRMGCEGHGIVFVIDGTRYDALAKQIVFCNVTRESVSEYLCYSRDRRYLIAKGIFDTYVIDLSERLISLYKVTVRDSEIWSEETAVWGAKRTHVSGEDGNHYYIQFPFVPFSDFMSLRQNYTFKRIAQLRDQTNAG